MPVQQICTVVEAVRLNEFATSMTLEVGDMGALVSCGQFVHIKCGHSRLLRRPISICDWTQEEPEDLLRIVFEARGEGTEWLSRRKPGSKLDLLGPLGHGFRLGREDKCLLVGGGIGVPPMLSCAKYTGHRSSAVLGFRAQERAMLVEDFRENCQEVFLCSDDGTIGNKGFADAQVRVALEKDNSFTSVLACGPKLMLRSVAKVAAEFGVPCQVSMEERMGCGVGACLVCACQSADGHMKHVCKDGPVFDAREVDWDA